MSLDDSGIPAEVGVGAGIGAGTGDVVGEAGADMDCTGAGDCGCGDVAAHGYIKDKKRYLDRLKRIEGQVRGVHRMVDEENYCIDILTQISALNASLKSLSLALLDDHLHHCVAAAATAEGEELDDKLDEAMDAIRRLAK